MIVPCECGAKLKIDDSKIGGQGIKVRCPRCGNVLPIRRQQTAPSAQSVPAREAASSSKKLPVVLVAHDSAVVRDSISLVVTEAGFEADVAADGHEALRRVSENRPKAIVLDVGLPGIYGFELCERLKGSQETSDIKIILLSSVYDMRRYKRTPVTLYGADDYIEKHHIPDFLPAKLQKMIYPDQYASVDATPPGHAPGELPVTARPPAREFQPAALRLEDAAESGANYPNYSDPASGSVEDMKEVPSAVTESTAITPESFSLDASIFQKEECDIPRVNEEDPEAVEKARRFARIIVSDIALYNQEAVAEGLKKGTFYELLRDDVAEGRELYENRVPAGIRAKKDYFQEAFDNFIKAQEKNVR
jgi:predicted Zn finger-like uncharacterized protein